MKTIITLFISFILLHSSSAFGQTASKNFADGEVYVRIKKEVPFLFDTLHRKVDIRTKLSFLVPLMNKYNITKAEASFYFSHSDKLKRTFRIHFGRGELVGKLIEELKKLNQIEHVEKIPHVYRTNISKDQAINQYAGQSALNNNNNSVNSYTPNDLRPSQYDALHNIHTQEAWDVSRGNRSVIIAIVASSIDVYHEDLAANVVKQWDVADDDANATGVDDGLGTLMAGVACATTNNAKGIASIGFNCGLMAVKTMSDADFSDYRYEGISWAVENGARVIACSGYNIYYTETEQDVINDAYEHNAIVVATAGGADGEGGDLYLMEKYPGAYNHAVAVAAVDNLDKKAGFSGWGSWVDVSAPGVDIYGTLHGNSYGSASITVMAVPFVAGLCGLIWSLNPLLSVDEVTSILKSTADNIDAQNPEYIGKLGGGRINAFRAVESALLCNPSINLGTGTFKVPKTESSGTITSKNKIPAGEQVIFDAATKVDLLPGFSAKSGCTFRAYIDGCGNKFALNNNTQASIKTQQIATDQKQDKISVDDLPVSSLNVFPNPAKSVLNVNVNGLQTGRYNLVVSNISGNTIMQKAISISGAKTTVQLSVADIPAGMYIVRIAENPAIKSVKFMKE